MTAIRGRRFGCEVAGHGTSQRSPARKAATRRHSASSVRPRTRSRPASIRRWWRQFFGTPRRSAPARWRPRARHRQRDGQRRLARCRSNPTDIGRHDGQTSREGLEQHLREPLRPGDVQERVARAVHVEQPPVDRDVTAQPPRARPRRAHATDSRARPPAALRRRRTVSRGRAARPGRQRAAADSSPAPAAPR